MNYYFALPVILSLTLVACDQNLLRAFSEEEQGLTVNQISQMIPNRVKAREAWASDIFNISQQFNIDITPENMCSIIAVVDQESNFDADPVVAGLGSTVIKELKIKLEQKLGKSMANYFEVMLNTKPTPENSYLKQIGKVKTERELDHIYREIFDFYSKTYKVNMITNAAKFVGQDIDESFNPVNTLGSMQVHIQYAKDHKRSIMTAHQLRDDLYTRYGGLYYGIHRLMLYPTKYSQAIYRFADYNSGMYSSRNAAFQSMLNTLTGKKLDLDGDLLLYDKGGDIQAQKSSTEQAIIQYFADDINAPNPTAIRRDLKSEKSADFENTATYQYIRLKYEAKTKKKPPYAIMPQVAITGPKINRDLKTNWYAENVNKRYLACMAKAPKKSQA